MECTHKKPIYSRARAPAKEQSPNLREPFSDFHAKMNITNPTPEPKPWLEMSDPERLEYFTECERHQPLDPTAFREAMHARPFTTSPAAPLSPAPRATR